MMKETRTHQCNGWELAEINELSNWMMMVRW